MQGKPIFGKEWTGEEYQKRKKNAYYSIPICFVCYLLYSYFKGGSIGSLIYILIFGIALSVIIIHSVKNENNWRPLRILIYEDGIYNVRKDKFYPFNEIKEPEILRNTLFWNVNGIFRIQFKHNDNKIRIYDKGFLRSKNLHKFKKMIEVRCGQKVKLGFGI